MWIYLPGFPPLLLACAPHRPVTVFCQKVGCIRPQETEPPQPSPVLLSAASETPLSPSLSCCSQDPSQRRPHPHRWGRMLTSRSGRKNPRGQDSGSFWRAEHTEARGGHRTPHLPQALPHAALHLCPLGYPRSKLVNGNTCVPECCSRPPTPAAN